MPGGFPVGLDVCNSFVASGDLGTGTISANTKTGFQQLIASTTYDSAFAFIGLLSWYGTATYASSLVDIAIGAAGSEQVILPNLISQYGYATGGGFTFTHYSLPLSIPAGTRIAGRYQTTGTGTFNTNLETYAWLILVDGAYTQMEGCSGADALSANTGTSLSTSCFPSSTANTKGSYTQMIASTSRDYIGLMLATDSHNAMSAAAPYLLDIAIGASGSEQIIIPNAGCAYSSANYETAQSPGFFSIAIPSGTRIAARCQCGIASGNQLGVGLYGVYA